MTSSAALTAPICRCGASLRPARRSTGDAARVLDVGAGTGRVALELARAGHRVTAVDLDDRLLGALRERSAEAGIDDGMRRCAHVRARIATTSTCA